MIPQWSKQILTVCFLIIMVARTRILYLKIIPPMLLYFCGFISVLCWYFYKMQQVNESYQKEVT